MSGDHFHFGDEVHQVGHYNIGMVKKHEAAGPQIAVREMIEAIAALRGAVPDSDRTVIDQSMTAIGPDIHSQDKGVVRRALASIAGIAAMVDQVGVPVIEAIRKAITVLGI